MTNYIGLDIGGTKIAGTVFSEDGQKLAEIIAKTPGNYDDFLKIAKEQVRALEAQVQGPCTVGICVPGAIDRREGTAAVANIPYINGKPVRDDLQRVVKRVIKIDNDANCIALAEAIDGAGKGYESVVGMTISTGVACGYIFRQQIVDGPHGMTGEFGHLPMPFRDEQDSPPFLCFCGQTNCLEKAICGGGLMRLYTMMTGKEAEPPTIGELARNNDPDAVRVLDRYFEMVAKSMIVLLYTYDPEAIVVSGGLSQMPGLFEEVPKRWSKYALVKEVRTKFLPAAHGPIASVRGAAWLWRD